MPGPNGMKLGTSSGVSIYMAMAYVVCPFSRSATSSRGRTMNSRPEGTIDAMTRAACGSEPRVSASEIECQ